MGCRLEMKRTKACLRHHLLGRFRRLLLRAGRPGGRWRGCGWWHAQRNRAHVRRLGPLTRAARRWGETAGGGDRALVLVGRARLRQPPRRRVDELREFLQQLLPLRWKGVGGEPEWTAGALVAGVSRVQAEVQTCSLSSSAPLSISSARRAAACSGVSGGATGDGGAAAVAADCAQARALGRASVVWVVASLGRPSVVWVVASAVSTCTKRGDARNGEAAGGGARAPGVAIATARGRAGAARAGRCRSAVAASGVAGVAVRATSDASVTNARDGWNGEAGGTYTDPSARTKSASGGSLAAAPRGVVSSGGSSVQAAVKPEGSSNSSARGEVERGEVERGEAGSKPS